MLYVLTFLKAMLLLSALYFSYFSINIAITFHLTKADERIGLADGFLPAIFWAAFYYLELVI